MLKNRLTGCFPVQIRPLTYKDIPYVVAIEKELFRFPSGVSLYEKYLEGSTYRAVVATENRQVAGMAALRLHGLSGSGELSPEGVQAEIDTLAVQRAFQGRGIDARLLFHLLAYCALPQGAVCCGVWDINSNEPVAALYERFNFRELNKSASDPRSLENGIFKTNADMKYFIAEEIQKADYREHLERIRSEIEAERQQKLEN